MLLSQAEAARIAGCTRANFCKMNREGKGGFFTSDGMIDSESEDWKIYLSKRGKSVPQSTTQNTTTAQARYFLARAKKMHEDAMTAELKRKKQLGELISVDVVRRVTYDYLEELNKRLLGTGLSVVDRLIQLVQAGGEESRAEVIDLLNHYISTAIEGTKENIRRGLDQYE